MRGDRLEFGLKVLGTAVALGGLLLGGAQFTRNQSVEAAKPFLEKTPSGTSLTRRNRPASSRGARSAWRTRAGRRWLTPGRQSGGDSAAGSRDASPVTIR